MRIFASERVSQLMLKLGMEEGVPDRARHGHPRDRQRAEEGRGAQLRNPQTTARVRRRHEQAARGDLPAPPCRPGRAKTCRTTSSEMIKEVVESALNIYCPAEQYPEEWDINGLDRGPAWAVRAGHHARQRGQVAESLRRTSDGTRSSKSFASTGARRL